MNYSNNFGSKYPNTLIDVGTKKDIDDSVVELINGYNTAIESGDLEAAAAIYTTNKAILEQYIINAEYFNRLEEEIYNVALLALKKTNIIVSKEQPIFQQEDSFWYRDIDKAV